VTIAGEHRPLGRPFHVLATQNPIEQEGTYPLPEAQLDRFLVQVDVEYPTRHRARYPAGHHRRRPRPRRMQVFDRRGLIAAQAVIRRMPVGESVVEAILDLVRACRPGEAEGRRSGRVAWLGAGAARGAGADADGAGAGLAGRAACAVDGGCGRHGAAGAGAPHGAVLCRPRAGRNAVGPDRRGSPQAAA
jgi:MoxR-like ATPase